MDIARKALVSLMSAAVLVVAACGSSPSAQQSPPAPPAATGAAPAAIASMIDARWIGFDTSAPWNWEQIERRITPGYQRFGFRPVGDTAKPRMCQGCGINPPTVEVTVYNPGVYDPTAARSGRPVDVNGRRGFVGVPERDHPLTDPDHPFTDPSEIFDSVMLVWEYADNAWATVRGMTAMSSDFDRMLQLARAVRPDERTPVKVPLSLGFVPAQMPLVSIHTDYMPVYSPTSDYGTTLWFGPCVTLVKARECSDKSDQTGSLGVQILRRDEYRETYVMHLVDRQVGGMPGKQDVQYPLAQVLLQRGYVEFNVNPRGGLESAQEQDDAARQQLDEVLDHVTWVADPSDDRTWQPVTDWVK